MGYNSSLYTEIKAIATARETKRGEISLLHLPNHDSSILVKGSSTSEFSAISWESAVSPWMASVTLPSEVQHIALYILQTSPSWAKSISTPFYSVRPLNWFCLVVQPDCAFHHECNWQNVGGVVNPFNSSQLCLYTQYHQMNHKEQIA